MKLLRHPLPDPTPVPTQLDLFGPARAATPKAGDDLTLATDHQRSVKSAVDGQRDILLGTHQLRYQFVRSKRRSIGFTITEDGLRVTAPRWVALTDVDLAIREKQRWILSKLSERRERSARRLQPQMQWQDGATLPFLGQPLTLRIVSADQNTRPATGQTATHYDQSSRELSVSLPPYASEQQLKDRVQGWLQQQISQIFAERLPLYAAKLQVSYRAFALSSAATQWGSCTADGKIRLNWRLVHFSLPLIDYVIAHELSHLREMNHSPRFWSTVQSIFPEFEAAKKALREHAPESMPRF